MTAEPKIAAPVLKYRVMSVEKTSTPDSMTGTWHRYVIGEGSSRIDGIKCGSLKAVTEHAETVAENLNARAGAKGYAGYASRGKRRGITLGPKSVRT